MIFGMTTATCTLVHVLISPLQKSSSSGFHPAITLQLANLH